MHLPRAYCNFKAEKQEKFRCRHFYLQKDENWVSTIKEKHIVVDTSQQSAYRNAIDIANQILKNETKN
jgi:hypothetical protein